MEDVAEAIYGTLASPNVADANGEPANVVDTLAAVAVAGMAIAQALTRIAKALEPQIVVKESPASDQPRDT